MFNFLRRIAHGQMLYMTLPIRTELLRRYYLERQFIRIDLFRPFECVWMNVPYTGTPWDQIPF